jgi:Ethanolamine utilization protein EutJ (predicted chaperonin)
MRATHGFMALLQIAEPNQSQAPHQHRLAVGIDLGTTNSLVATVRSGQAATLSQCTTTAFIALGGALFSQWPKSGRH